MKFQSTSAAGSPACASTRAPATPAPTRAACGAPRARQLATATFTNEIRHRVAAGQLRHPGRHQRRHDLHRLLLRSRRALRGRRRLLRQLGHPDAPAAGPGQRRQQRQQRRLRLRRPRLPGELVRQHQLLGRRRAVDGRGPRHDTAHGQRPYPGRRRLEQPPTSTTPTATFSEPVQPASISFTVTDAQANRRCRDRATTARPTRPRSRRPAPSRTAPPSPQPSAGRTDLAGNAMTVAVPVDLHHRGTDAATRGVPVQHLERLHRPGHGDGERRPRGRARRALHRLTRTARSPASASTRAPATPAPTSAPCGAQPGRSSPRPPSPASPPAAGRRSRSRRPWRSPRARPTSPRTTPTSASTRPPRGAFGSGKKVDNPPLHAPANGHRRAQRRLPVRLGRLPDQRQRRQLLGRRGLRPERRHLAAHRGGPQPRDRGHQRGVATQVKATMSEAIRPAAPPSP